MAWAATAPAPAGPMSILRVPVGTEILDAETGDLIADLKAVGDRVLIAKGGNGGWGNAQFKSSTNRAPRRANPGQAGIELTLLLRLKLIADIGIIGLPNAGKSTFLAAVSAARPKIADYPFTTLHPGLGVVQVDGTSFVMADIPGLIEGAHDGAGLGIKFLKHVERCRALLHLVDGTQEDVAAAYRTVRAELAAYSEALAEKPEIVALNKCDALTAEMIEERTAALEAAISSPSPSGGGLGRGMAIKRRASLQSLPLPPSQREGGRVRVPHLRISGAGITELLRALARLIAQPTDKVSRPDTERDRQLEPWTP